MRSPPPDLRDKARRAIAKLQESVSQRGGERERERGGVLVAAAEQYGLPIHAIGVGEKLDDLRPFDADLVARVIAGVA